jgi:hypothetical protein
MESPLPSNSRSNATRRFSAEILRIPHPDTRKFRRTIFQTGKDQALTMDRRTARPVSRVPGPTVRGRGSSRRTMMISWNGRRQAGRRFWIPMPRRIRRSSLRWRRKHFLKSLRNCSGRGRNSTMR